MSEPCVAVFGPGLLGGSLARAARAAREAEFGSRVHIWARRESAVAEVERLGIADRASTDPAAVLEGATIAVLATPIGAMSAIAEAIMASARSDHLVVTDVGSVKARVVQGLGRRLREAGIDFVGSHPMAGSERTGIAASRSDLFQGAVCIVTPEPSTPESALARVTDFWKLLGCAVWQMAPDEHDAVVGKVSHVPHIAAAALTLASLQGEPGILKFAGPGFRDSTRIAGGDPDMWAEILLGNREALDEPLRHLADRISQVIEFLKQRDQAALREFLRSARSLRSP